MDVLTKAYPTTQLSGLSELVRQYSKDEEYFETVNSNWFLASICIGFM